MIELREPSKCRMENEECRMRIAGPFRILHSSFAAVRKYLSLLSHIGGKGVGCEPGGEWELRFWTWHPIPKVTFCEDVAGTAFQVLFEMLSLFNRLEGHINLDLPRLELRRVRALSGIVLRDPLTEVRRMTNVTLVRMTQALDYVCVKHVTACHP